MSSSKLRFRAVIAIRDSMQSLAKAALESVDPAELVQSCVSCDHFVESSEACKISGMQRPPARIIAFGCPKWENIDDDIPF